MIYPIGRNSQTRIADDNRGSGQIMPYIPIFNLIQQTLQMLSSKITGGNSAIISRRHRTKRAS